VSTFSEADKDFLIDVLHDSTIRTNLTREALGLLDDQTAFLERALVVLRLVSERDWHAKNFMERYSHVVKRFEAKRQEIEAWEVAEAAGRERAAKRPTLQGLRGRPSQSASIGSDRACGERELPMSAEAMSGDAEKSGLKHASGSLDTSGSSRRTSLVKGKSDE
jgi:hypothetical protein